MTVDRKLRILRNSLDTIVSEANEPIIRVYAQSALDETVDIPQDKEHNTHCAKHNWYGAPKEHCPLCTPSLSVPNTKEQAIKYLEKRGLILGDGNYHTDGIAGLMQEYAETISSVPIDQEGRIEQLEKDNQTLRNALLDMYGQYSACNGTIGEKNLLSSVKGLLVKYQMEENKQPTAALSQPSWVSVQDGLPDTFNSTHHSERVLTMSESGHYEIGYLTETIWRDDTGAAFHKRGYTITHWTKLPNPPANH